MGQASAPLCGTPAADLGTPLGPVGVVREPRRGGGSILTPPWGSSILTLLRGGGRGGAGGGLHPCDPSGQTGTSPSSPITPLHTASHSSPREGHHCYSVGQSGTSPPSPSSPLSLLHPTLAHRTPFHRKGRHLCDPTGQAGAIPSPPHHTSARLHPTPPPPHPTGEAESTPLSERVSSSREPRATCCIGLAVEEGTED